MGSGGGFAACPRARPVLREDPDAPLPRVQAPERAVRALAKASQSDVRLAASPGSSARCAYPYSGIPVDWHRSSASLYICRYEPYTLEPTRYDLPKLTVPEGSLFVLGALVPRDRFSTPRL